MECRCGICGDMGFEALFQTREELGVERARTGAPKAFSRRATRSCADGTIIVIIMNLWNCRLSVTKSKKLMLLWNTGVSRVEIYHKG
jgi:hypothetical protein